MTNSFLLAAAFIAAPPDGRITAWVGDKVEHFKPDGTDVQTVELPDGYQVNSSTQFNPARTASLIVEHGSTDLTNVIAVWHYSPTWVPVTTNLTKVIDCCRLILAPLYEKEPYFVLEGYVVLRAFYSADGKKVYFVGGKGDELPRALTTGYRSYGMDV